MANYWLRLWHDMPNDPKWRTIAKVSRQPIALVLSVYVHLLVDASLALERGCISANPEDLASALDEPIEAVGAVLKAMDGRVVENGRLTGWEKRQPKKEDGAAERAKHFRERKRTETNANERSRTQTNADKDKEKDKEKSKTNTLASTAIAVTAVGKLLGTLPLNDGTDWEVYSTDIDILQPLYPAVDVRQELREMKGYFIGNPHKRKTRRGIKAFITSWLAREQDSNKSHRGGAPHAGFKNKAERTLDALRVSIAGTDQAGTGEAGDSAAGPVIDGRTGAVCGGVTGLPAGGPPSGDEILAAATRDRGDGLSLVPRHSG